jgi:hypothetical protein
MADNGARIPERFLLLVPTGDREFEYQARGVTADQAYAMAEGFMAAVRQESEASGSSGAVAPFPSAPGGPAILTSEGASE